MRAQQPKGSDKRVVPYAAKCRPKLLISLGLMGAGDNLGLSAIQSLRIRTINDATSSATISAPGLIWPIRHPARQVQPQGLTM